MMDSEPKNIGIFTSRRNFLKGFFAFIGSLGLGSALYGLFGFLARGEGDQSPVEISMAAIPSGSAYFFRHGGSPGILIHEEEGNLRALSLVCTHLGCTVVWNPEKREFHCPCHDGLFDADGRVLSGPPPSPLERLKVKINGENVVVG
jgi:cytochrome b6-f complex iron-sulfur subunit